MVPSTTHAATRSTKSLKRVSATNPAQSLNRSINTRPSMTSLTGKTEQTLKGTVSPPTLAAALGGSVAQFGILAYVWINATSLGDCVTKRTYDACLDDPWSRQVIGTLSIGTPWSV